jgi:superfamily II DNA/RNA helicase
MEHKAYLHRSGRTARAGASGTVVTLMTDTQVADVRDLTRKAGITATVTRLRPGHPLLTQLAPGERTYVAPSAKPAPAVASDRQDRPARGKSQRAKSTRNAKSTRTPRRPSASDAQPAATPKTGGVAAFSAGGRRGRRR